MTFVCLSPSSVLLKDQTTNDSKDEIHNALNSLVSLGEDKEVCVLPGGGIVAARGGGRSSELAVEGPFIAVLTGTLQNYAYLVRKYCLEELSLPTTISLEAIRDLTPVREATLLCRLYERLGTGMLTKLRGKFSLCVFDSKTTKVLAARDSNGTVPLVTGETEDGFLFVATDKVLPEGVKTREDIEPGQYIYGWGTTSLKYTNPITIVEKSAAEALDAASAALKGIKIQDVTDRESRRNSRGISEQYSGQRRRAVSSEPYRRNHNIYIYNHGTPDVQAWRQPFEVCPSPAAYENACYQRPACYPEASYRAPSNAYEGGRFRQSRQSFENTGHRIRRPSLEPNWRVRSGDTHYSKGMSPEATMPVYVGTHVHPEAYNGQPMVSYIPEAAPKSGFKIKKSSRRREESVSSVRR